MKSTRWFLIIAALYILGFIAHALILQKTVYGDGIFYYSWIHSVVVDHDINFGNEYKHFSVTAPTTKMNTLGNKHPIGAPLFWLPWYTQAYTIIRGSGYELPYQLLVGFVSVLAALSGLALLYRLLLFSFSRVTSMLTVIAIALTTNLFFYGSLDSVNSHAISFFAAAVFLSLLLSKNVRPFFTGCALGFCALIRPQDAALGMLAVFSLKRRGLFRLNFAMLFSLGAMLVFSPQLFAWHLLYGTPLASPYLTLGESFDFMHPHVLEVLFSPRNGLFLYTPILIFGLLGLLFWENKLRPWFLCTCLLVLGIIASWSTWWQGASYSGRMFISALPIFSFGLAAFFRSLQNHGLPPRDIFFIIVGPLSVLNILFIFFYLLAH